MARGGQRVSSSDGQWPLPATLVASWPGGWGTTLHSGPVLYRAVQCSALVWCAVQRCALWCYGAVVFGAVVFGGVVFDAV